MRSTTTWLMPLLLCACGAANGHAQAERQALRDEVSALTQRLDQAEKDRAVIAEQLARLEQQKPAPKPAPPPPTTPKPPPKIDPIGKDALTTCKNLQKEKALNDCRAYQPKGLAWKGAKSTARFLDPTAAKACGPEDVCMIVLYADEKAYAETKSAVKSVDGLPIYFNDTRRLVLKVDARISKEALARLTRLLSVVKVSTPAGL